MIIYNVTVKVEKEISENWVNWMQNEHIPDLLNTGLFNDYTLSMLLEQDESDGITYIVQYHCENMEKYNHYIEHYAPIMREKAFIKFGNKFIAFRTLMKRMN